MRKFVCKPLPGDASDPQGLAALVDRYLLWMETHHYAPGTVKVRTRDPRALPPLVPGAKHHAAARRNARSARAVQRHVYYYRQRNGQPLSLSSQSHRLTSLRRWCAWLHKQRSAASTIRRATWCCRARSGVAASPALRRRSGSGPRPGRSSTPHGLRNRATLEVLYSTGLRREEALRLEHTDLDRERGTLLVRRGKGKKDRFVPIGASSPGSTSTWPKPGRSWRGTPRRPWCSSPRTVTGCMPTNLSKIVRDYLRRGHRQAGRVSSLPTLRPPH